MAVPKRDNGPRDRLLIPTDAAYLSYRLSDSRLELWLDQIHILPLTNLDHERGGAFAFKVCNPKFFRHFRILRASLADRWIRS